MKLPFHAVTRRFQVSVKEGHRSISSEHCSPLPSHAWFCSPTPLSSNPANSCSLTAHSSWVTLGSTDSGSHNWPTAYGRSNTSDMKEIRPGLLKLLSFQSSRVCTSGCISISTAMATIYPMRMRNGTVVLFEDPLIHQVLNIDRRGIYLNAYYC